MRHEFSLINHGSSKTDIKELGSTTEGLRRGLNFAHQLLESTMCAQGGVTRLPRAACFC